MQCGTLLKRHKIATIVRMKPTLIKDLLASKPDGKTVTVCGWVRTVRDSKNLVFIQVNDGSCFASIQLTFDRTSPSSKADVKSIEENLAKANTGASVRAEIEIQVTPEREHGFDAIAERIYRFPQVRALYLMSGSYDLKVIIEGESLQDVAFFVARKLSALEGVRSTKTHFILKTYKENDVVYVSGKTDGREGVTA